MRKKLTLGLSALFAAATLGLATQAVHAENLVSFLHWAPAAVNKRAETPNYIVDFTVRIPRNAFAPRDAQIDIRSATTGAAMFMEMLVACSNNTGRSGSKYAWGPADAFDDFTLTCPSGSSASGVQGGLGIQN